MIREIITDELQLSKMSIDCTDASIINEVVQDLIDTANAHKGECLGLAANQIGYPWRIFVLLTPEGFAAAINPEVTCMTGGRKQYYEACLSRPGSRKAPTKVKRYKRVKIKLTNSDGEVALLEFKDLAARIVQHELDHLDGILI
jgi:peptide deformylase